MRYRIKDYEVSITGTVRIEIAIKYSGLMEMPSTNRIGSWNDSVDTLISNGEEQVAFVRYVIESIRLIADETVGGYVLMSTGQKGVLKSIKHASEPYDIILVFVFSNLKTAANGDAEDLSAINAIQESDQFTIDIDWGE